MPRFRQQAERRVAIARAVRLGAGGALRPYLLGMLQNRGIPLTNTVTGAMLISGLLAAGLIWLGPDTRGRVFTADEGELAPR